MELPDGLFPWNDPILPIVNRFQLLFNCCSISLEWKKKSILSVEVPNELFSRKDPVLPNIDRFQLLFDLMNVKVDARKLVPFREIAFGISLILEESRKNSERSVVPEELYFVYTLIPQILIEAALNEGCSRVRMSSQIRA